MTGQRGPGCLADEPERVRGGHHPDIVPRFGEQPEQLARLVGGDTGADPEDDAHRQLPGRESGCQDSAAPTVSSRSLISRSAIESGFS